MAIFDKINANGNVRDFRDAAAVRFNESQSLTDAQKAQGRQNIGAAGSGDLQNAVGNSVHVNEAQSLTAAQQQTARTNIGAASADDLDSLDENVVHVDKAQTLTSGQKAQARVNISAASEPYAFMGSRSVLADGSDANSVTRPGSYAKPSANTVSHLPTQGSGFLYVFNYDTAAKQFYQTTNDLYFRTIGSDWISIGDANRRIDNETFVANRAALADGSDANTIIKPGSYSKSSSVTVSNLPVQTSGYLYVFTRDATARQFFQTANDLYFRVVGQPWTSIGAINTRIDTEAFVGNKTALSTGDDADNITVPGSYAKPAAATVDNLPTQSSGYLYVLTCNATARQLYQTANGLYFRTVGNNWISIGDANNRIDTMTFVANRAALANGSDANDVTLPGSYSKASSATVANLPVQKSGYLYVFTRDATARQFYQTADALYYRVEGKPWIMDEHRLYGKTLIALGDSLIYGQGLSAKDRQTKTWLALLASRYGMTTYNYGVSGTSIAHKDGEENPAMVLRIDDIITTHASQTVDYFVLEGGANDFSARSAFGELSRDNIDNTTFYGAINIIINKVKAAWPKARILLMTNYDRKLRGDDTLNDEMYVNAMVTYAKFRGIPYFDNYHDLGVSIRDYINPDYDPSTSTSAQDKYLDNWMFGKSESQHLTVEGFGWVTPVYARKLESI